MCGIAGIIDYKKTEPFSQELIEKTIASLKHRGPDGHDAWSDNTAMLVHTRLSIIDLSETGRQPMFNADRSIVSVFNGEIYNFLNIRKQLQELGYTFKGASDAEILPFLYQEYGIGMLEKLEGIFAFSIYDTRSKKLIIARDRLGIKPLYYHHSPTTGRFYFGSELKAILLNEEVERTVDFQAIYDYLGFNVVPEPATGFRNIFALSPASVLELSEDDIKISQYWDISKVKIHPDSFENTKAELKERISSAVDKQLISDAPLGAFLSGGIDSSIIVAIATNLTANLPTFTVKFPDASFDESIYARKIAGLFKTQHRELELQAGSGDPKLIKELIGHFDQPYADTSSIPTYLIAKEMQKHIKVALSGDGGDEILGGYHAYWFFRDIKKASKWLPGFVLKAISKMSSWISILNPNKARQLYKFFTLAQQKNSKIMEGLLCYTWENEKQEFLNLEHFQDVKPTSRIFGALDQHDDAKLEKTYITEISKLLLTITLPSDMLKKVDMMSMKAGVEVRVPLLDEEVVEYAVQIAAKHKLEKNRGKIVLREILKDFIPSHFFERPKQGFGIPFDQFASPELISYLRDMLLSSDSKIKPLIKQNVLVQWIEGFEGKTNIKSKVSRINLYHRVYALLSLELWMRKYNLSVD